MRYLLILFALTACVGDETATGYAQSDGEYTLVEIGGSTVESRATIAFDEGGRISGQAPCNRYFTQSKVPYPWFEVGPIGATKMACPNLAEESEFFRMLEAMTLIEFSGPLVLLTNDDGASMTFRIGG